MRCAKCGAANPEGKKFCGDCGVAFVAREDVPVPGQPGVYYCSKHKKETTRVTCGRCEKPVCTRCAIHGPVGVRCRECAKNRVPIRPRGVLHSAGQGLQSGAGRTVWYLAVWYFVVSFISNLFGGFGGHDS
jgi:hypothetical protein